jgi:hypothetical protein
VPFGQDLTVFARSPGYQPGAIHLKCGTVSSRSEKLLRLRKSQ